MKAGGRKRINLFWIVFWIVFLCVWGVWGWENSGLFEKRWFFDAAGHALSGFAGALTIIHLVRSYAVKGVFLFAGQKFLMLVSIASVIVLSVLWEGIELLWDLFIQPDYLNWLARAQQGSADTTIDILISSISAAAAAALYAFGNSAWDRLYPDAAQKAEIENAIAVIKQASADISFRRRENIKRLRRALKKLLKDLKRRTAAREKSA